MDTNSNKRKNEDNHQQQPAKSRQNTNAQLDRLGATNQASQVCLSLLQF